MNTKASVAYGWGVLILAGGGAYYFAKRSINADREERAVRIEQERRRLQDIRRAEYATPAPAIKSNPIPMIKAEAPRDPSISTAQDPAPTSHAEETDSDKFAAKQPWRSRKGDRFS